MARIYHIPRISRLWTRSAERHGSRAAVIALTSKPNG